MERTPNLSEGKIMSETKRDPIADYGYIGPFGKDRFKAIGGKKA